MVWPPAVRAPRAAASITPPRPPHSTTAPRVAMARPTSNASAHTPAGASPAPMTAMEGKTAITLNSSHPRGSYRLDSEDEWQFGQVLDDEVGRGNALGN